MLKEIALRNVLNGSLKPENLFSLKKLRFSPIACHIDTFLCTGHRDI